MNFEEDIKESDLDDDYLRVNLAQTAKSHIYEDFSPVISKHYKFSLPPLFSQIIPLV